MTSAHIRPTSVYVFFSVEWQVYISLMWLHSNMWTTPRAFRKAHDEKPAFISHMCRLHKVSILQEHSSLEAYWSTTTSIFAIHTNSMLFGAVLSNSQAISQFHCFKCRHTKLRQLFFGRACITSLAYRILCNGIFRFFFLNARPTFQMVFSVNGVCVIVCVSMQFDGKTKWTGSEKEKKNWQTSQRMSGRDTATL